MYSAYKRIDRQGRLTTVLGERKTSDQPRQLEEVTSHRGRIAKDFVRKYGIVHRRPYDWTELNTLRSHLSDKKRLDNAETGRTSKARCAGDLEGFTTRLSCVRNPFT